MTVLSPILLPSATVWLLPKESLCLPASEQQRGKVPTLALAGLLGQERVEAKRQVAQLVPLLWSYQTPSGALFPLLLGSTHWLHLHAFPRCRGPLDGRDDLVAPDGVSEVRNGVSPVLDVCRERGVGTPDVVGGRSFQAGERGPFLRQRRRDCKLGGVGPPRW